MASLIVAGSTGAIGRTVVQHAARNKNISRIVALTRSGDTARENYPKLFGIYPAVQQDNPNSNGEKKVLSAAETSATAALQKNEVRLTEEEMAKIVPVTFDWDFFLANWQQLKRCYNFLPANGDATSASWLKLKEGNAAMVTVAGEGSNEKKERHSTGDGPGTAKVGLPMAAQLARWRDIFAGHTYCAMALGTTRADAGSADNFIRCDYDYVIAFTEAVLCFSAPGGFPFDGRPREPKGFAGKQRPISTNEYFLYNIGDKASPVKPTAKGTDGATITFAEAFPRFKTVLPETVFMSAASTESGKADGAEVALSSRTLRRFCQISAYNASKSSFLLYPKVKGAADAAVAERILYTNTLALAKAANKADDPQQQQSGNNVLVELSFVMPGLLERYEKTRGVEKFGKWVMSAIGVEKCGACAVANFVFDDKHLDGESASEDDLLVATTSSSTRSNKHAFSFGTYYAAAAERQQVEANSNKMLFFWQGNAEIEKQAARLAACARDA